MERLSKLVNALNSYEKSSLSKEEAFSVQYDSTLSALTKSNAFGDVYRYIKDNKLKLNGLLLPYRLFKDENNRKVYVLKEIEEFKEDYVKALGLLEKYYENNVINRETYYYLKNNFSEMKSRFSKEFKVTKLDKLDTESKVEYELCLIDVNKKKHEYLSIIGSEAYANMCSEYDKAKIYQKNLMLIKQNKELRKLFGLNNADLMFVNSTYGDELNTIDKNVYKMNGVDIAYYSYDILLLEQLYKLKCIELIRKNKNLKLMPVLLEEYEFKKSNYSKTVKNNKKKR